MNIIPTWQGFLIDALYSQY